MGHQEFSFLETFLWVSGREPGQNKDNGHTSDFLPETRSAGWVLGSGGQSAPLFLPSRRL